MDNQTQQVKHNDEVDLIEIFIRMGRSIKNFFIWIGEVLKSLILLLIRKSIWIGSFAIVGVFVGYFVYSNTLRYYSSEMVARSNAMNNSVIINSINLLSDLFENKNYTALANYLGTTSDEAKKIKSIDAFYGIDINRDWNVDFVDYDKTYNPKDTNQRRISDIFYLRIRVYDKTIFSNLKEGIKKYISNNQYVLQNSEIRKLQDREFIQQFNSEIKKLDSLQKVQYFEIPRIQKGGNGQLIFLNEKEIKLYHNEIINLYARKFDLEKDLALNPDPITVIQDFTQLSKTENPLIKFLKIWVSIFAVLGFFSSLLWQYREKIMLLVKS